MSRCIHGLVKDADHENPCIFNQIIYDMFRMGMAEKPDMQEINSTADTRIIGQILQRIPKRQKIGFALCRAKKFAGINIYAIKIGIRPVGKDVISHCWPGFWRLP